MPSQLSCRQATPNSIEKFTQGVKEMRTALGYDTDEALRIPSAIYGLTNAVRILWEDADRQFSEGGAENTGLEPCVWLLIPSRQTEPCGAIGA